ncbi:hypothetical protein ASPZODRAFT_132927 [Penicilliopsis zonata CBS 506.65]|uniref:Amino-acid acetyltransferase, mitochondrial n=1 Tax=Penicilliopsis zonata CBS 506.65 TaxID=1073090 RepID=A0A1L9SHU0_9EURO|nr:hypothetical protein ASPZODRAFT_132927 [Penicilliopsis zonata CBS 506.65]OJJ46775.1 hypothetical protein ASPZODRAFT_132927 [Penicilliopsis zonata CBS 506.65]
MHERLGRRAKEKLLDRDFFLSLLNSASTKREAKQYLARFKADPKKAGGTAAQPPSTAITTAPPESSHPASRANPGVTYNGAFYGASRSVYDSPVFRVDPAPTQPNGEPFERLHLALVKIAKPQMLEDYTIDGVAKTLSQLTRLGMSCCVVIDPGTQTGSFLASRKLVTEQADRISRAVDGQPHSRACHLDSLLALNHTAGQTLPKIFSRKPLLSPLRNGQVTLISPIAYMKDFSRAEIVPANDVMLALTKEFAGLGVHPDPDEDPMLTAQKIQSLQREVSLDRVIILDPLGGIPALSGTHQSHVFLNMEQEFEDVRDELQGAKRQTKAEKGELAKDKPSVSIPDSNPLSQPVSANAVPTPLHLGDHQAVEEYNSTLDGHLENLRLSQRALSMLPSTSSGIITSPKEVSSSAQTHSAMPELSAVGTRRQRNPLIHNLLTDKPILSSSLPVSRRGLFRSSPDMLSKLTFPTTFVKRGMPISMIPNPRVQAWSAWTQPRVRLDDPCIDLPRLVNLIEDSFGRKLDVHDYLNRINDRIAGLIIAGEYEGGAILTWETPPGVVDDGSDESLSRMVPYLDKFAVLKRSQGAGGVADVVFNAMLRTCFPSGVCWRSRKDNPVNKWYFERSQGTWKLSDSNWTMFWTTPGLVEDSQKFRDYEAVCRSIQPSWADNSSVVD